MLSFDTCSSFGTSEKLANVARSKITMSLRRFPSSNIAVLLAISIVIVGITYFALNNQALEQHENYPSVNSIQTPDSLDDLKSPHSVCYSNPRQTLNDFLDHLRNGDFINASRLYDGDYLLAVLRMTPESISTEEKEKLIAKFLSDHCTGYGTCLPHKTISEKKRSEDEFWYDVMFDAGNGAYEFCGPYQGDSPQPTPVCSTQVKFVVRRVKGCFKSLDIPPITP